MTREEIVALLATLRSNYPHAKIPDAEGLVNTWELTFGNEDASRVYKAARLHMESSSYFPTIADIRKKIGIAVGLYNDNSLALDTAHKREIKFEESGCKDPGCPYAKLEQSDFCPTCAMEGFAI